MNKKIFENHVPKLTDLGILQILNFKAPGKREYELEFIFKDNMLYVTGDCKDAVFNCTWNTSWDCRNGWNIHDEYFAEKLSAHCLDKYVFDNQKAIDETREYFRQWFTELEDEEYVEMFNSVYALQSGLGYPFICDSYDVEMYDSEIKHFEKINDTAILYDMAITIYEAKTADTHEEFVRNVTQKEIGYSTNEWISYDNVGLTVNPYITLYLTGLQEAYKKLKLQSGPNGCAEGTRKDDNFNN